jgi:hypothetical protein
MFEIRQHEMVIKDTKLLLTDGRTMHIPWCQKENEAGVVVIVLTLPKTPVEKRENHDYTALFKFVCYYIFVNKMTTYLKIKIIDNDLNKDR